MRQKQLTQKERYHIWASLKRGVTQKEIADNYRRTSFNNL